MTKRTRLIVAILLFLVMLAGAGLALYVSQINTLPDSSYALFGQVKAPTAQDKVLVVSPHEDDETLGAGGYIQQAVQAGAQVKIILATDGNKHGLKDQRHQEELTAAAVLGVKKEDITFYDYPDSELSTYQAAFTARLEADITNYRPAVVVTTLPEDIHPDHAACGKAVHTAYDHLNKTFTPEFFLIHYHRYPRPLGYQPDTHLLPPIDLINEAYLWQVLPLSQQQLTTKTTAINDYKTQLSLKNPILTQLMHSFERQNELFATYR